MEQKAKENLGAAKALLLVGDEYTNAATSRAYYAAYLACWTLLVDQGHQPRTTDRGTYFPHKELPDLAQNAGVLTDDERDQLEFLESQRVVADYYRDDVTARIAHDCLESAERFVMRLDEGAP